MVFGVSGCYRGNGGFASSADVVAGIVDIVFIDEVAVNDILLLLLKVVLMIKQFITNVVAGGVGYFSGYWVVEG